MSLTCIVLEYLIFKIDLYVTHMSIIFLKNANFHLIRTEVSTVSEVALNVFLLSSQELKFSALTGVRKILITSGKVEDLSLIVTNIQPVFNFLCEKIIAI